MKRWFILILLFCWAPIQVEAAGNDDLIRGIVYFLVDDMPAARMFLERHFQNHVNPQVRQGYMLLLDGKHWEATRRFSSYLEINHRSAMALVGVGLSTRNTKNSNAAENFFRAVRLEPGFSAGHVCLGWHFQQARDYDQALTNYQAALSGSAVADIRILMAGLFVHMQRPDLAEAQVREEADAHPDSFHFNYMTALALVNAGQAEQAGRYLATALEIQPEHRELGVLRARYLYRQGKLAEARSLLSGIQAGKFHEDYLKIYSRVLIALKESHQARPMLYQLFGELPWDAEVNLLLGEYTRAFRPQEAGMLRHWARRALLAGAGKAEVESLTGEKRATDPPQTIGFFSVRAIAWPFPDQLVLVGKRSNRESEQLYVVNPQTMRLTATFSFRGGFQAFFRPMATGSVFFTTSQVGEERTFLYQLELHKARIRSLLLTPQPLPFPSILLGTNAAETLIYVTDSRLGQLAFTSPFAVTSQLGEKKPLYPASPFPMLMLNRRVGRWTQLKSAEMLDAVPIPIWKKYRLVQRARSESRDVDALIQRGMEFDIASPEMVRILVAPDNQTLLLYLADLENAFQAVIYNGKSKETVHCSQRMFLGAKSFADVDVKGIDPVRHRLLLVTRDKDREAILFHYRSRLYQSLGLGVMDVLRDTAWRRLYLLKETGSRKYASETRLDEVNMSPPVVNAMTARTNLKRLVEVDAQGYVDALTHDGEIVRIKEPEKEEYLGVSLEGALHAVSPDQRARAAFINDRLVLIPRPGG